MVFNKPCLSRKITSLTKTIAVCRLVLAAMVLLVCPIASHAQNNAYKIDDRLYDIYAKAYAKRATTEGVQLADSMYRMSLKLGDKKAECIALTIPVLYNFYMSGNDNDNINAIERLKEVSVKNGYMQYYYYAENNRLTKLMNQRRFREAMKYTNEMKKYAIEHKMPYGIYTAMRSTASIYQMKEEYRNAIDAYKEAREYAKENVKEQDLSGIDLQIATCYKELRRFDMQLEYAENGLKISKTTQTRAKLLLGKAYALAMLERDEEFKQVMENLTEEERGILIVPSVMRHEFIMLEHIAQGKLDEAMKYVEKCDTIKGKNLHFMRQKLLFYEKTKDYKNAFYTLLELNQLRDSLNQQLRTEDINALSAELGTVIEKQEAQLKSEKLKNENNRLTLLNTELELGRIRASEKLAKLDAENLQLGISNQKLVNDQLIDSIERQRELLAQQKKTEEARQAQIESERLFTVIIAIIFIVMFIIACFYVYNRIKMSRRLQIANDKLNRNVEELQTARDELNQRVEELKVARDAAQQADNMKTMFLQNMSHEIRTPLNAIVGFSQVLVSMGDMLSDEEKNDMSQRITENSDLLTTIINDILDLTTIESGKYVMNMSEEPVNNICRTAMDTVMHRKPEGVEMVFTSDLADDYKIKTDSNRVKQVLINFLTNAEKNTTEGKITLSVNTKETPGKLQFIVTDTGIGIPKEKMDEIFERFKKLDTFKQGTGLGLNICMAIAERLGGRIFIDRDYHDGARFIFEISI